MTETQQTPAKADKTDAPAKVKRYAAYDLTYEKFVGGVHKDKAKATAEAKDRKLAKYEVREV